MTAKPLLAATIYVTEASPTRCLEVLRGERLLSYFADAAYDRCSYCVGGSPVAVKRAVLKVAKDALERLDMRNHKGTHPTLGIVDHISVHPLRATLQDAADAALSIGTALPVPVLYYGAAHPEKKSLAEIRRGTTYFQKPPDDGLGVCCCGATPHVLNYNVQVTGDFAAAKRVASAVRTRGGNGLPGVEALALRHNDVVEIACNLLDDAPPPEEVKAEIKKHAEKNGLLVVGDYVIGRTKTDMLEALLHLEEEEED